MVERSIVYRTLNDVVESTGLSKKRVQKLFDEFVSVKGVPKEVFKFKASWGGWVIAFPDSVFDEFVRFIKNPGEFKSKATVVKGFEKSSQVSDSYTRLMKRLLAGGVSENVAKKTVDVVKMLNKKGLYGKSVANVEKVLHNEGFDEKKVSEILSYYRLALLHDV